MATTPGTDKATDTVIIIGAGIVGTCCAIYLQRLGMRITMIDQVAPGQSCSFGHAGVLSAWNCVPDSLPGTVASIPRMLFDPEGPLAIRWQYLPQLIPWFLKFLRAGHIDKIPAISNAMFAISKPTVGLYKELVQAAGEPQLIRETSYLNVFRKLDGFNPDAFAWRLRREHGIKMDFISGGEVQELEPEISPHYSRGVLVHNQGHTSNPGYLVETLANYFKLLGGSIVRGEVKRLSKSPDASVILQTTAGELTGDFLVIAAGAWSHKLTAQLGCKIPLETQRGYHMTFANPGITLKHPVMETNRKFVTSTMEMGIRCAGTAEFAGLEAPANLRRANILAKQGKELLPRLNTDEPMHWMGHRSALPDGLPAIGPLPGQPNVLTAFGHGHTGVTSAPMTGRIIANLISNMPQDVDIAPYRPDRF